MTAERLRPWLPWLVGSVLALVVIGPALAPGLVLNLDLVVVPDTPVPRGVWGLGPELPRRVPFFVPVAWASAVGLGGVAMRALLVGGVALAFVGGWRLVGERSPLTRAGAGALLALGPFLLTRVAVGHLTVVWAAVGLAWGLPWLLRPVEHPRRAFGWALALALTGSVGGSLVALAFAVGVAAARGRGWLRTLGILVVSQAVWWVPGVVVWWSGGDAGRTLLDGQVFATRAEGIDGAGRVLAGMGFWQDFYQVAHPGALPAGGTARTWWWVEFWAVGLVGLALGALALAGASRLDEAWRARAGALAGIGLLMGAASALPVVDDVWFALTGTALGAPVREGHRMLALYVVWMAPAAAVGAERLAERLTDGVADRVGGARSGALGPALRALPLALALVLSGSGWWGVGGHLRATPVPADWAAVRSRVTREPGPVLALPWHQYLHLGVARDRLVLNPLPLYLGGDVLISSDFRLGDSGQERGDPREPTAAHLVEAILDEEPVGDELAGLGVRWVVLLDEVDADQYRSLDRDPGLEAVHRGPDATLYAVRDWGGAVRTTAGAVVEADPMIAPWWSMGGSGPATAALPGARGWLRGTEPAATSGVGALSLPAGSGPLWYWPAVVVVLADLGVGVAAVVVLRRRRPATAP